MSEKEKPENEPTAEEREAPEQEAAEPTVGSERGAEEPPPGEEQMVEAGDSRQAPSADGRRHGPGATAVIGLVLAVMALMVGGAGGAAAWYLWQQQQRQEASLDSAAGARDALQDTIAAVRSAQQELRSEVESANSETASISERQATLERKLQQLNDKLGTDQGGWIVAEAEYLLRIANQRLQLARDIGSAAAALRAADARLRELADPAYLEVREAIADELARLEAIPQPDVDGIALRLSSLADTAANLPLLEPYRSVPATAEFDGVKPGEASDWREFLAAMWKDIKGLVTIRREGAETAPLLPPDQRYFLRQNLRLKLETAQLALLRREPAVYDGALKDAAAWVNEYFQADAPAAAGLLNAIAELRAKTIKPDLPDISGSLRALVTVQQRLGSTAEGSGT